MRLEICRINFHLLSERKKSHVSISISFFFNLLMVGMESAKLKLVLNARLRLVNGTMQQKLTCNNYYETYYSFPLPPMIQTQSQENKRFVWLHAPTPAEEKSIINVMNSLCYNRPSTGCCNLRRIKA